MYSVGLFCIFQSVLLKALKLSLVLHNQCLPFLVHEPAVGMGGKSVWERWRRIPIVGKSRNFPLGTVINNKHLVFPEDASLPVVRMRAARSTHFNAKFHSCAEEDVGFLSGACAHTQVILNQFVVIGHLMFEAAVRLYSCK